MRGVDVNVLVFAHRADAERHSEYRDWLEEANRGDEPLGLSGLVFSGFLRIVTHPRVFRDPTPVDAALQFVDAVRSSPAVMPLEPGPRHWAIFSQLCRHAGARGNQVPDAFLAALAMEAGASWVSADRGFARFPGLRWVHPLDA
ncbi:MAG TPA: type II toxin-antitoxin system VapC family toxin [Acidimicrobiales bacterium]|nr:type II toxin-antitoxin system VapC family toxin [Acidimicrobiales bacterium]